MFLRKGLIAAASAGAVLLLTVTTVLATTGDTDDHFNVASGTTVKASSSKTVFTGKIDGATVTVTCTKYLMTGKAPSAGLTITIAPPTISGCHDSLGGTDTVKTNATYGKWKVKEIDKATDESSAEPNSTGDKFALVIPKKGATFVSSIASTCKIIVAPSGAATVTGTYNDAGTSKVTNGAIPVVGSGCSASSPTHVTTTVTVSPKLYDKS